MNISIIELEINKIKAIYASKAEEANEALAALQKSLVPFKIEVRCRLNRCDGNDTAVTQITANILWVNHMRLFLVHPLEPNFIRVLSAFGFHKGNWFANGKEYTTLAELFESLQSDIVNSMLDLEHKWEAVIRGELNIIEA